MDNETLLAHTYKEFMMTPILEQDIKLIKKINNLMSKFNSTEKSSYIFEIINILSTMKNSLQMYDAKTFIVALIDNEYKNTIELIIDNLDNINIQKLRELNIVYFN